MMAKYGERKQIRLCYGTPPEGHFALDAAEDKPVHWDHCREQFAPKFTELVTGFYFSHKPDTGEGVSEFVTKFEKIFSSHFWGEFKHSVFSLTSRSSILWVEPSKFWLDCPIKRSLFTILLRCGYNYQCSEDNFDDALFGEYKESTYTKETKSAILRFLFGFTTFTGGPLPYTGTFSSVIKHGWREEFHKSDDATVRRRLVIPNGERREISIIGLETLWT